MREAWVRRRVGRWRVRSMVFMYYRYWQGFRGACVDYMYLLGDDRWVALWCYTFAVMIW